MAYGERAVIEATASIRTLRKQNHYPVAVVGDRIEGVDFTLDSENIGQPGRWAKTMLFHTTPFVDTLFLDADTRVHGDVSWGFRALDDGWDFVIVPSKITGEPLHHLDKNERLATLKELGDNFPLMLNTGVMWFKKNERTQKLFDAWHKEWLQWRRHDQGALLRALRKSPVKLFIAGRPFNGGEIVEHLFGRAAL